MTDFIEISPVPATEAPSLLVAAPTVLLVAAIGTAVYPFARRVRRRETEETTTRQRQKD